MIDHDDNIEKQNELSKFILTQNPNALNVIDKLISLLINDTSINEDLLNILYNESTSDIDKFEGIVNKLKSISVLYIKRYGILIDEVEIPNIRLKWFFNVIYTLKQFNNLNSVEYLIISDYLSELDEDPSDNNIIDITYKIFQSVNLHITNEMFIQYVSKVYIDFLTTFREHVNKVLISMEGSFIDDTNDNISEDVVKITKLFITDSSDVIPTVISNIIENPLILDMLIINSNSKYLDTIFNKLNNVYNMFDLLDYYIVRLLGGDNISDINEDVLNIINDDNMYKEVMDVLNKHNAVNTLTTIRNDYLEGN